MSQEAIQALKGPAVGLKVTAVVGVLLTIANIIWVIVGGGMAAASSGSDEDAVAALFGGTMTVVFGAVAICLAVLIWIGATKMTRLESYGLCMAASIIAMIPCISPCCFIGLPIGIWAIVMLVKPEVKEAFTS